MKPQKGNSTELPTEKSASLESPDVTINNFGNHKEIKPVSSEDILLSPKASIEET